MANAVLARHQAGDWTEARNLFSQLAQKCDNTDLCQLFLDRISQFEQNEQSQTAAYAGNWDGVFEFDTK